MSTSFQQWFDHAPSPRYLTLYIKYLTVNRKAENNIFVHYFIFCAFLTEKGV